MQTNSDPGDEKPETVNASLETTPPFSWTWRVQDSQKFWVEGSTTDHAHHAPADAASLQEFHEHFHRPPWRPSDRHRCRHKGVIGSLIRCVCGWVGR